MKPRSETVLREVVGPIRIWRGTGLGDRSALRDTLREGTAAARVTRVRTLGEICACSELAKRG